MSLHDGVVFVIENLKYIGPTMTLLFVLTHVIGSFKTGIVSATLPFAKWLHHAVTLLVWCAVAYVCFAYHETLSKELIAQGYYLWQAGFESWEGVVKTGLYLLPVVVIGLRFFLFGLGKKYAESRV